MRLAAVLGLMLAASVFASPQNIEQGAAAPKTLWSGQGITTSGATTTDFYQIGTDDSILVDVSISEVDGGGATTVTLTPTYQMPGGNIVGYPLELTGTTGALTWTNNASPHFLWVITPPKGAEYLYLQGLTNDATAGVTISAKAIGTR